MKIGDMYAQPIPEKVLVHWAETGQTPQLGMTIREAVAKGFADTILGEMDMETVSYLTEEKFKEMGASICVLSFELAEIWLAEAEKRRGDNA